MLEPEELADRVEITELLHRYASGVARKDMDLLLSLFTDDVVLEYYGREALVGHEGVRTIFDPLLQRAGDSAVPLDERTGTCPLVTNIQITVDGDLAQARSYCLATHAGRRSNAGLVLMRATTNDDHLRRTPSGWKISRRVHGLIWGVEVPASKLAASSGE